MKLRLFASSLLSAAVSIDLAHAADVNVAFTADCGLGQSMPSAREALQFAATHPGTTIHLAANAIHSDFGVVEGAVDLTIRSDFNMNCSAAQTAASIDIGFRSATEEPLEINGGNVTLANLAFNRADSRGALFIRGSTVVLDHVDFVGNRRVIPNPTDKDRSGGGALNIASRNNLPW